MYRKVTEPEVVLLYLLSYKTKGFLPKLPHICISVMFYLGYKMDFSLPGILGVFPYFFRVFSIQNNPKNLDTSYGSRFLGLFRKGKTCVIAKFYRTDLITVKPVLRGHPREAPKLAA